MNQALKDKLVGISDNLITEASEVIATKFKPKVLGSPTYVNKRIFHKWWAKVKSFNHQLGSAAKPWHETLSTDPKLCTLAFTEQITGTLEAIKHELENDHLATVTELVVAETLGDLLEQAEHLYENGYHLAAGVLGRAILEEQLRKTCEKMECTPTRKRPTINDYNVSLYKTEIYTKTKMKQIDVLATIGNDAAHNNPDLESENVEKLLSDLPEVIESIRV